MHSTKKKLTGKGESLFTLFASLTYAYHYLTEANKGQSQNIYEIRKNVFKIRKNISNRNVFWKSSLKSLSNLKNYYKS